MRMPDKPIDEPLAEPLPGAWLLRAPHFEDPRGSFTKTFAASRLRTLGLAFEPREQYVTWSRRDVVRGLHYQRPPHDHAKLVCCLSGAVQDVIVDLRRGPGYGRVAAIELSADDPAVLVLPPGIAHGFRVRSDGATMLYMTSSEHAPDHDTGVLWTSVGHDWDCPAAIVSARDAALPPLAAVDSPF